MEAVDVFSSFACLFIYITDLQYLIGKKYARHEIVLPLIITQASAGVGVYVRARKACAIDNKI